MPVKIVTGNIGSGKTRYCVDAIKRVHDAEPERRCLMLVPSYYSHETEKLLINEFGGTGLNNIDAISFEKMARELLDGTEKRLSAPGKQSLICRAVELCIAELDKRCDEFDTRLCASVRRPGFLDVAQSLISELHRYVVNGQQLRERAESLENGLLRQKLEITAMISDNYDRLLSATEYIDSDEDLLRLAAVAGKRYGKDSSIWIDKFDEFLPQQMQVVNALIDGGADITITFNTCDDEEDMYYGTRLAMEKLAGLTDVSYEHLEGGMKHLEDRPDLQFLFSNWFNRSVYTGDVDNAEVFGARDSYTEIEHIASRILDLVREDKFRYRDITVICGNPDSYSHIIGAVFDEYDIPYYSDETLSVAEHPIAMQVLSLFDIIENNWNYDSMFEYLRAGFVYYKTQTQKGHISYKRIPSDSIDILENYVLKYGIRGKSMWCRAWNSPQRAALEEVLGEPSKTDEMHDEAERLRAVVTAPIEEYCNDVKRAKTVTDYCHALYNFLERINLYQGLKTELLGMAMNRATADAQRFGQIWNLVLDVIDQVNTALGSCRVTESEFCNYIRAAMTKCGIRTIPSGVDRVFIGSVEKNQSVNTKVLFMAGAVSGTFPSESVIEGFLSNADREYLEKNDIRLAPVTGRKNEKQYNSVYKTLSAVTDRLCVSYPVQTTDGNGCRPSQTVIDIIDKLKNIRLYDDIIIPQSEERRMYISSPKATLHKLLIHPKDNPLWLHVNAWFNEHDEWRNRLFTINKTRYEFTDRTITLNPELSKMLYHGRINYSATRLNSYASCPFRYFLQYGLRAKEREIWEINAADTGNYAHEIIRRFCDRIDHDDNLSWDNLSGEECDAIVDEIVSDTIDKINHSEVNDKERTVHIFRRMGKTVKGAARMVCTTLTSGAFEIAEYEKDINTELTENIGVCGRIDRLDICSHDGVNEYRIIDYKTGKKDFKVSDIYHGYDMQPVIYAMVMRKLDKKAMISGLYYSSVRNDYAKTSSQTKVETQLKNNTKLSGVTFLDFVDTGKKALKLVKESANRVESELSRANGGILLAKAPKISAKVRPREDSELLMDMVYDKVIESDREIRNGNIGISPMGDACKYCDYSSVCKFDEAFCKPREYKETDLAVWKKLKEEK